MTAIAWNEVTRKYYSYEQERETLKYAKSHGMTEFVVAYGGVRLIVRHIGTTLIEIRPKAKSANPDNSVGVCIFPPDKDKSRMVKMRGENYDFSYNGGAKVLEAIREVFTVWNSNPDRDAVYKVVGGKTCHCAMCGADLTDELSTSRGIGPECWRKIWRNEFKQDVRQSRLQKGN